MNNTACSHMKFIERGELHVHVHSLIVLLMNITTCSHIERGELESGN